METPTLETLDFQNISSTSIRKCVTKLRQIKCNTQEDHITYTLCYHCRKFLDKIDGMDTRELNKISSWKYTWSSFLCNLLCGKDSSTNTSFFTTYENNANFPLGAKILWKCVSNKICLWYLPLIEGKLDDHLNIIVNDQVKTTYEGCSLYTPLSYFADRGEELCKFEKDIGERTLEGLLRQPRPLNGEGGDGKSIIMHDVLCPWGGTEFLFQAHACPFTFPLLIQHQLRDVTLNMPSCMYFTNLHLVETSRMDSFMDEDSKYENQLTWRL